MSDMRLKFALSNGGSAATDVTPDELSSLMTMMQTGGMVGIPGMLINTRHIVAIELEAIKSV